MADSSVNDHPMAFSLGDDGTHNGHSRYEDYRVVYLIDGTDVSYADYVGNFSGATSRAVRILFPDVNGINTMYYYCVNHAGMGGDIPLT